MKIALKILIIYITLLCICLLSMTIVHLIPSDALRDNVQKSANVIKDEGLYPELAGIWFFKKDNFTDVLMLNIAISSEDHSPLNTALRNVYYCSDDLIEATLSVSNNEYDNLHQISYGRYWHGYLTILRPLLSVMSYPLIRFLNYLLFLILITLLIWKLNRKVSKTVAVIFGLVLLLINFWVVPCSMQFSTCFYITFISILIMLQYDFILSTLENTICFFFIVGGLTSFFDLLTTPQITLGLPLILFFLVKNPDNKLWNILKLSIAWGSGYAMIWSSKWIIGSIITGIDILASAKANIIYRTSNLADNGSIISLHSFISNYPYITIMLIISIVLIYALAKFSDRDIIKKQGYLLLIGAIPICWFIIIPNHSFEHLWFTWRSYTVTIMAVILFTYYIIDSSKYSLKWKK